MKKVIIIGAGITGMSAASYLIKSGYQVEIFESSNKLGGRCFSFYDKKNANKIKIQNPTVQDLLLEIDNGQHLFSGAYQAFFELMQWLGNEKLFSEKIPLNVDFVELNQNQNFNYKLDCNFPANILGFFIGLIKIKGIKLKDKLFSPILFAFNFIKSPLDDDLSVKELLKKSGFSDVIIQRLWKPMVVAMLNSPIDKASGKLFLFTLKKMFAGGRKTLNLVFARMPLSKIHDNFLEKIQNSGNAIHFNSTVKELIINNGKCVGIVTAENKKVYGDYVISTLPPKALSKLNNIFLEYNDIFPNSPIISIYLWLKHPLIQNNFTACVNSNIEWIFNRNKMLNISYCKENLYQMSITISAADNLIDLSNEAILEIISAEIKKISANKDIEFVAYRIIKDRNATSLITFENNSLRPSAVTAIDNFYLAGDWVQTNLPATIESAALSGKLAVEALLGKRLQTTWT